MIDAIITQLKTGTIPSVFARGGDVKNKGPRYVIVADGGNVGASSLNQAQIFVTGHFQRGFWSELNDYMGEIRTLLSDKVLTDGNGITFQLETSGGFGPLIDTNDDGSISRELTFIAPGMVL